MCHVAVNWLHSGPVGVSCVAWNVGTSVQIYIHVTVM